MRDQDKFDDVIILFSHWSIHNFIKINVYGNSHMIDLQSVYIEFTANNLSIAIATNQVIQFWRWEG